MSKKKKGLKYFKTQLKKVLKSYKKLACKYATKRKTSEFWERVHKTAEIEHTKSRTRMIVLRRRLFLVRKGLEHNGKETKNAK